MVSTAVCTSNRRLDHARSAHVAVACTNVLIYAGHAMLLAGDNSDLRYLLPRPQSFWLVVLLPESLGLVRRSVAAFIGMADSLAIVHRCFASYLKLRCRGGD